MSASEFKGDELPHDDKPNAADSEGIEIASGHNGPPGLIWESTNCKLCGSANSKPCLRAADLIYNRVGSVQVVRCLDCGHFYQDPRPTPATIGIYYDADYGPHVDQHAPEQATPVESSAPSRKRPWYLAKPVRAIPGLRALYHWLQDKYGEILPDPPSATARALEIGCGRGRYLHALQQKGWHVEGIEPGEHAAQQARDRGLQIRTGTFESFQLEQDNYDAIIAWHVIEHLHDPNLAMREIRRLLRPSGQLLISVPNFGCWERWFFGRYNFIANEPTHLQHFTRRSLRRLLEQNGFRIVRFHGQQNVFNITGSIGIWLRHIFLCKKLGDRFVNFADNPSLRGQLALAPLAKLLAAVGQAGRFTVVAVPDENWSGKEPANLK